MDLRDLWSYLWRIGGSHFEIRANAEFPPAEFRRQIERGIHHRTSRAKRKQTTKLSLRVELMTTTNS